MITTDEFKKVAQEVLSSRGYFVIGCPPHSHRYFDIGEITHKLMQFDVGEDFEVFAKADDKDWDEQSDFIGKLRPQWTRLPRQIGGAFFKVRPVSEEVEAQ